MRLRERDLTTVYLKKRIIGQDDESNDVVTYANEWTEIKMTIQDAGGAVAAQIYGERLDDIKTCKYQGDKIQQQSNEGDGICLYVDKDQEPDFKIISIKHPSTHTNITLEWLGGVNNGS